MSRVIVLATRNPDKARELQWLFADLPVSKVVAADHLGDDVPDVDETGTTLEENALLKARALARFSGELCIADDTGLEVDALDGRPGVYAARYAGPDATYADNCDKLVAELQGVPEAERTARFRTVMALVDPRGEEGTCSSARSKACSKGASSRPRSVTTASATTRCSSSPNSAAPWPRCRSRRRTGSAIVRGRRRRWWSCCTDIWTRWGTEVWRRIPAAASESVATGRLRDHGPRFVRFALYPRDRPSEFPTE